MTTLTDTLKSAVASTMAATTREELGRIYEGLVGYDAATDDPEASVDDLASLCLDYVREVCYANGIHCATVGFQPQ